MTTSNIAIFTVTRDEIVNAALRVNKVLADGVSASANDLTNCGQALNLILKTLYTEGYLPWLYQTISFTLAATTASYTIGESGAAVTAYRPVRIASAYRRDASTPPNDIALTPLSRQEYEQTTPKTTPGYPTSYYYDPQVSLATIYFWPVPADATQTARLLVERPVQDITSGSQNFDLPQEWLLPLKWILADEVSEEYELDDATIRRVAARAKYWRDKIADFSREEASVFFQPDPQVMQRGGLR